MSDEPNLAVLVSNNPSWAIAEITRLREALRDLLSEIDALPIGTVDPHSVFFAREALSPPTNETEHE